MAFNIEREVTITAGQLKLHFVKFLPGTNTITTTAGTFSTTIKEPMCAFGSTQTTTAGGTYRPLPVNIGNAAAGSATSIGKVITVDPPTAAASAGFVCVIGR